MSGWPLPLPDWIAHRSLVVLSAIAGVEQSYPWDVEPEPDPIPAEVAAAAEAFQREHSAMRDEGVGTDG